VTMNRARFSLLSIFVVFLSVQLVAFSAVSQKVWPEEYQTLMLKVLAIYSVHLTVILGAIFAQARTHLKNPPAELAWIAILLALLWNLALTWRSISFSLASQDSVRDLIKYLDSMSSASSFLVTGALAFFFTKGSQPAK